MKTSFLRTFSLLFFICGLFAVSENLAATLTVTKTADTTDSVCDADCSLREAIFAAASGDTVVFSPLFNSPQTITLTAGQLLIGKNLTIAGAGADLLTISGNNAGRIFYIFGGSIVALSGMTLKDGRLTAVNDVNGGSIYLIDSALNLTNMTLSSNTARFTSTNPPAALGRGGAVFSDNSVLSVFNSTISNNDSPSGGGIYSESGIVNISRSRINNNTNIGILGSSLSVELGVINVVNSTFDGNSGAAIGGGSDRISVINSIITNNDSGVFNGDSYAILTIDHSIISNGVRGVGNRGTATISNTLINNNRNNSPSGIGGGIFNVGTINIINSAVTNNIAGDSGGGIYNGGQLFLTNSTISGNIAGLGGGISNGGIFGGTAILTNSTIANNHAIGKGGGLYHDNSGTVTVRTSIIASNTSSTNEIDASGTVVSQGFNLIGNTTGSIGWTGADLLNRNPLLAPLGNNGGLTLTHALMPGSPAINAGNNALAKDPTTNVPLDRDQRGYARFMGSVNGNNIVDIGAYESDFATSPVSLSGRVLTNTGRSIDKVQVTLTDANGTIIYARTNAFGYYRFVNLPPATTYTITVIHKRYRFNSPQVVTVDNNRNDLNFIASL